MTQTAIMILHFNSTNTGFDVEYWYGNGVNRIGESISLTIKKRFIGEPLRLLRSYLTARGLRDERPITANHYEIADLLLWLDDWSVIHLNKDKIETIEIFRQKE
jgi:hypothetical protein